MKQMLVRRLCFFSFFFPQISFYVCLVSVHAFISMLIRVGVFRKVAFTNNCRKYYIWSSLFFQVLNLLFWLSDNDVKQPSSPSVKKSEEKGVVVVHEVKCKLYVKVLKSSLFWYFFRLHIPPVSQILNVSDYSVLFPVCCSKKLSSDAVCVLHICVLPSMGALCSVCIVLSKIAIVLCRMPGFT